MGGLFDTLSIGRSGLTAQQVNIDVTSHNITNSETDGYTRQRANATASEPLGGNSKFDDISVGQVGTGVEITSIERVRDKFADIQVRDQQTSTSFSDIQNSYLSSIATILDEAESGNGVKNALSDFYNAFSTLTTEQNETQSNKTSAISAAETLAERINSGYKTLDDNKTKLQENLQTNATTANDLLDQINDYNEDIEEITSKGLTANDLMDKRDLAIDKLSEQFGITVKDGKNNGVDIYSSDGTLLVDSSDTTGADGKKFSYINDVQDDGAGGLTVSYYKLGDESQKGTITISAATLSAGGMTAADMKKNLEENRILEADSNGTAIVGTATEDATNTITAGSVSDLKNDVFTPSSGEIAGNKVVQNEIDTLEGKLDEFAQSVAYSVNAIQTGNSDQAGDTTDSVKPLFVNASDSTSDAGITAKNITINSDFTYSDLNCDSTSTSGNDGARAKAISEIKDLKFGFGSTTETYASRDDFFNNNGAVSYTDGNTNVTSSAKNGTTLSEQYSNIITGLDEKADSASSDYSTAESKLETYQNNRTSVSGVSIDEEMSNLIEFQHAYQASAKVVSTVSDLLDTVIGLVK
jgi:flagellar hook-associated protein 1 FlgK